LRVTMHHCQVFGNDQKENRGYFEEREWTEKLPDDLNGGTKKTRPRAMTWIELMEHREELNEELKQKTAEIATFMAKELLGSPPAALHEHIKNLQNVLKHKQLERRCVDAEIHMRPALSFGCLFFVLVGCPVGIWFSKSDYLSAFITCF